MLTLLRDVSIVPGERRKTTAFEDSDRATRRIVLEVKSRGCISTALHASRPGSRDVAVDLYCVSTHCSRRAPVLTASLQMAVHGIPLCPM